MRLSLRTLIFVILLASLPCAWVARERQKVNRQSAAKEAFEQLGGFLESGNAIGPPRNRWLTFVLGDDFSDIENATASDSDVFPDNGVRHLAYFPSLREVILHRTATGDDDTVHLSQLKHLRTLLLSETKVGDAGIAHLAGLKELEWLTLDSTSVSDDGLKAISGLHHLKQLELRNTAITDRGLALLAKLPHLELLFLEGTAVTEKGMEQLETALPELRIHDVDGKARTTASERMEAASGDSVGK
jgi:hypothetical protein